MWTDRDAIRNAFVRLGYPTVKRKQLEARAGKCSCLPVVFDILRHNDSNTKSVVLVSPLAHALLSMSTVFMVIKWKI